MPSIHRVLRWAESNARAAFARPYSNLLIASDSAGWVLDEEGREMIRLAGSLGFRAYFAEKPRSSLPQCVHYTSFFSLANPAVFASKHRIGVDYFHGKPNQDLAFRAVYDSLKKNVNRIHRLRLSYSGMKPLALEAGVPEEKIHLIPIGINPSYFTVQDAANKKEVRERLGIPQSAVVIGSFQKDGQGWGDGMEPKWVKGPDVFVRAVEILKGRHPEIFVLLTGPARGYVKAGLEKIGVPYKHVLLDSYGEVGEYYQALDLYLVASREEGGPKAVLESMISGVPLVTTRVGQAIDLVKHGENALMAEVEEAEALAHSAGRILQDSALRKSVVAAGLATASGETYDAQRERWRRYFQGYVEFT
jgi:glycosyltransferase involved in cell wall biosynthesis